MRKDIYEIKETDKVCLLDLDEVLCVYTQWWLRFLNKKLSTNFTDLNVAKNTVPYDTYRKLKEEYRTCGIKELAPVVEHAKELVEELKKKDWKVYILTARPVDEYPSLYRQTINWLKKNDIYTDGVFFAKKRKYAEVLMRFPHVNFIIDDNSYDCNLLAKWGYKVFLKSTKYNKDIKLEKNVIRIDDLLEVLKYIEGDKK